MSLLCNNDENKLIVTPVYLFRVQFARREELVSSKLTFLREAGILVISISINHAFFEHSSLQ